MADAPLLECRDLHAGWGATEILGGLDLTLDRGETLAVLGRNGVGKTTLLSAIIGRARQTGGSISFAGKVIDRTSIMSRARSGIALVPQEREIFASLTVQENLEVSRQADGWTLDQAFDLFPRLGERNRNLGSNLSGGEQQMLAIARALMTGPSLLMLDEPMEGLAPVIVDHLVEAINRIRQETGIAVLLVEQHVKIALSMSERLIVMDRGQIIHRSDAQNPPDLETLENLIALQVQD